MKTIFLSLWILMTVALTACSSSSTVIPGGSANNNLPIQTQLALGTLKLDGTDWDVTAAQAQELVILWQVYRELSQSDTAAQAEVDGLIAQIQETMTTEQLQAIADMQITQQDVLTAIQGMTVVTSSSTGNAVSSPSNGGMPAGGPPMEGGAPPEDGMPGDLNGAGPSSSNSQAQSADTGTSLAGSAGVPAGLVEALIQLLEQKSLPDFSNCGWPAVCASHPPADGTHPAFQIMAYKLYITATRQRVPEHTPPFSAGYLHLWS